MQCIDEDTPEGPVPCSITLETPRSTHHTQYALIRKYIELDRTFVIRDFLVLLRAFVRVQGIVRSDKDEKKEEKENSGGLSTYAWTVLAIHVLLRFQILPNIHTDLSTESSGNSGECSLSLDNVPKDVMSTYPVPNNSRNVLYKKIMSSSEGETDVSLEINGVEDRDGKESGKEGEGSESVKESYEGRLLRVSVLDLFHLFFGYLTQSVDVYGTVLTLRGEGEVK